MRICEKHWTTITASYGSLDISDTEDREIALELELGYPPFEMTNALFMYKLLRKLDQIMPKMDISKIQDTIMRNGKCPVCFGGDSMLEEAIQEVKKCGKGALDDYRIMGE